MSQEPPTQVADLTKAFNTCDTCSTPDIYLIIADEYAGKTELQDVFSFDNSRFENELKNRGFFIIDSSYSNYNATVYSMSSMFSMDYLHGLQEKVVNHRDMFSCRSLIKQNNLISFLKDRNYEFYNYSPFDFAGKNNFVITPFFATKKELFTSQTFTNRFWRSMGYHFVSDEEVKKSKRIHLFNNIRIDSMTKKTAAERINSPKFVYTHIALPHHPYYYDSAGKENPYDYSNHKYPSGYPDYIQYLIYSNKKLLEIVDHIRSSSQRPAIIILMSDHGFRQLPNTVDAKYHFMTLNAVYFPNENYSGFYKGMSNVNQFRIILNSQFGQKLPILKDSSFFLVDP